MPMPSLPSVTVCGGIGVMVLMVGAGDTLLPIIAGEAGMGRVGVSVGAGTVAGGDIRTTIITIITRITIIIRTIIRADIGVALIGAIAPIPIVAPSVHSVRSQAVVFQPVHLVGVPLLLLAAAVRRVG